MIKEWYHRYTYVYIVLEINARKPLNVFSSAARTMQQKKLRDHHQLSITSSASHALLPRNQGLGICILLLTIAHPQNAKIPTIG